MSVQLAILKGMAIMLIDDIVAIVEAQSGLDEFDCYEAVHAYCILNHEGMWSDKYKILSSSSFCPGPMWSESRVEAENIAFGYVEGAIKAYYEAQTADPE